MTGRLVGTIVLAAAGLVLAPSASADEVVHFRNGAEMPVRTHTVSGDMVKLDLGGGNSISFPLSMVDKIASAGQDVYLNPVYHPANQAVSGPERSVLPNIPVQDMHMTGVDGGNVGLRRMPGMGAAQGTMIGEPALGAPMEDQFQKRNGMTSVPVGNRPGLRKVIVPTIDNTMPFAPTGQGTIPSPESSQTRHFPHISLLDPIQPPPPAPAPASDGKTEAGTPPQSN